jgi:hypothetical protein
MPLVLSIAACAAAVDCPRPPDSAERTELRKRLWPLVRISQCPPPPTPRAFEGRQAELFRRQAALIDRVDHSPVAEDLVRVRREQQEASGLVSEADCAMPFWDRPEDPENVAAYPGRLEAKRRELEAAESAFARATACDGE